MSQRASDLDDPMYKRPTLKKKNGHEIWDMECKSLYGAGSIKTVAEEISKYKLYLWEYRRSDGTEVAPKQAGKYTFFYGKGSENHT
jgi:hypothetical protein